MAHPFKVGIMKTFHEKNPSEKFSQIIETSTEQVRQRLTDNLDLDIEIFDFSGPSLNSTKGTYSPLDFLQLGLAEKLEREIHFLLIVVEVDLSASMKTYVVALPSQLMNIGVLSIKRLSPGFWGKSSDEPLTTQRLTSLMLHTLGHLLNLEHVENSKNIMYPFRSVTDLDAMHEVTEEQITAMRENIPIEAHEKVTEKRRLVFGLKHTLANIPIILQSITNTNPFYLVTQLPTVMTAAFSVIVVLFFTAEIWDVAGVLEFGPLIIFSIIALLSSTGVFYSTFKIGPNQGRGGLSESTVVMVSSTLATLFVVNLLLYSIFLTVSVLSALAIFPDELKTTWTTAQPASGFIEQLKLGMFLATMGVLTGSLGGKADSRSIIQQVLFLDEET